MMHSATACSGLVSRRSLNQTECGPVTLFKERPPSRAVEAAAEHLRGEQSDAARYRPRREDFEYVYAVVVDGDVKVLPVEGYLPRRADQLARTLDANHVA